MRSLRPRPCPPRRPVGLVAGRSCPAPIPCALICALLLAGCGSAEDRESRPLEVKSPALTAGATIPSNYECREKSIWVPLSWGEVPNGTEEIVVAIGVNRLRREGNGVLSSLAGEWFISGLDSHRRTLKVGALPDGARLGTHAPPFGSLCPHGSAAVGLVFSVYAMPDADALGDLEGARIEAGGVETVEALADEALAAGHFTALYRGG